MLVYHVELSKRSVATIFQVLIIMQAFRITLIKPVSKNISLAMGKFSMVIYFPILTNY